MTMKAFFEIEHGAQSLGRLVMELYDDRVPKTVRNFTTLIERGTYRDSVFHRIIPGFMAQGGDFERGDGTGGSSIYGKTFDDEDLQGRHQRRGQLSMANAGPHTNGSQFFIAFRPTPHLDGKHVVFGHVLPESMDIVDALENVATSRSNDRPLQPVLISSCGLIEAERPQKSAAVLAETAKQDSAQVSHETDANPAEELTKDEEEIDLDEEDEDEEKDNDGAPLTKAQQIKQRLRKLKQKMNQARQLNRQAVKEEGGRIGKPARRNKITKSDNPEEDAILRQSAAEAISKSEKTAAKAELRQYSVNDYHNPEGQFRNYQRNLKSIKRGRGETATTTDVLGTFNPIDAALGGAHSDDVDRQGARRLAQEMHRRIEKRQKREADKHAKELMDDDEDVNHINQRNKRFNQKINRTYDKATAEIRQNLERGTAL
uniref:peptidylprolyl isomerase n=1 Tax=Amphora coffeiformis TaxID=265554 RepID=A0A7S3L9D9_9STRA|eukprot:scaffold1046_cov172-Amphora_coffeaeformis.AAC.11